MRSKVWCYLIILMLSALILGSFVASANELVGFELACENGYLELYYLPETAEIAVLHKESGAVWFSNPQGREQKETMARGASKARLGSQVIISYYTANQQLQMDSFNDSVLHGQHTLIPLETGLRVEYKFGQTWQDRDFLPTIISEERFNEEMLANIPRERDRTFLREMYGLFSLEQGYDSGEDYSILGVDFAELLGDYGIKVEEPGFRVADKRRLFQEYLVLVKDAMKYESLGEVQAEEITGLYDNPTLLLKWNVMQWDIEDAIELVKTTGYRPEDAMVDHQSYNVDPPFPDLRQFQVVVEYILDQDQLVVRVPGDELIFPDKVYDPKADQEISYPLTSISVLPYFGAADKDDEGYLFIPDGPGALTYFNQINPLAEPYSRTVYGQDYALLPIREYSAMLKEQVYLPVFGAKRNNEAFFAIIEQGDASARIEAMLPGMRDSYNRIWSSFKVRPAARVAMEAEGDLIHLRRLSILMYQARLNKNDIVIRYNFLSGDNRDYAGMARLYQQYLVEKHGLTRLSAEGPIPLVVDVVGSMDHVKPVLGIPTNVVEPMTTHEQTLAIVDELLDQGIENLHIRYLGWMRGGIRHVFPSRAPLERSLGNKESWLELSQALEARGVGFYPNVDFLKIHRNQLFDSYLEFRHGSRGLNRSSAFLNTFNIATYQPIQNRKVPLLSPGQLERVVDSFSKSYSSYDISGLSLGDLGILLFADYRLNPNSLVDRVMAADIVAQQGANLTKEHDLMVAGGNAYLLPFADILVHAPLFSRSDAILHQTVPFYPMVISGHKLYAGDPFNIGDYSGDLYFLKTLETGALPYFSLSWQPSALTKNTDYNYLFATHYAALKDDILSLYNDVNQLFGDVWAATIVDHQILAPNVVQTTYDTGLVIVVNYTTEPHILHDGLVVPALGYTVMSKGGE